MLFEVIHLQLHKNNGQFQVTNVFDGHCINENVTYKKYSDRILNRYILHTKDLSKDQDIVCLPIYMTPFLTESS